MDDERLEEEYLALIDELNAASEERQGIIVRFRAIERLVSGDDLIFAEWDAADERVAAAMGALRSFLVANQDRWRP